MCATQGDVVRGQECEMRLQKCCNDVFQHKEWTICVFTFGGGLLRDTKCRNTASHINDTEVKECLVLLVGLYLDEKDLILGLRDLCM